jgi:hypothetical protein
MKKKAGIILVLLTTSSLFVTYSNVWVSGMDPDYVTYLSDSNTYKIKPTGTDDTSNIQEAFDNAIETGPGSTVQLGKGEFILSKPIQVADFDGVFRGEGAKRTTVRNKKGIEFPLATEPLGAWPFFFVFYLEQLGGSPEDSLSITVSDMKIQCYDLPKEWKITFPGSEGEFEIPFTDYNPLCIFGKYKGIETREIELDSSDMYSYDIHAGERGYYDITVERMDISGYDNYVHPWDWWGKISNVHNGICIQGWIESYPVTEDTFIFDGMAPMTGNVIVRDCNIGQAQYGVALSDLMESVITITDNSIVNRWTSLECYTAVELFSFIDSNTIVAFNKIRGYWDGIYAYDGADNGLVYDNTITASNTGVNLEGVNSWKVRISGSLLLWL